MTTWERGEIGVAPSRTVAAKWGEDRMPYVEPSGADSWEACTRSRLWYVDAGGDLTEHLFVAATPGAAQDAAAGWLTLIRLPRRPDNPTP